MPVDRTVSCFLVLLFAATSARAQQSSRYSDAMFRAAIDNHSTAPNYVLVTIREGGNGSATLVCIEAPFLEGALHREHDIAYSESGDRDVRKLLFASHDHTYTFSKSEALANVAPRYTPEVLAQVRSTLASRSKAELRPELLASLYEGKHGESYAAYRDAIAHVLLERGILCGRGCVVGTLYVEPR